MTIDHRGDDGRRPILFFLGPNAPRFCPELEGVPKTSPVYKGHIDNPFSFEHNIGIADCCSVIEGSCGKLQGRAKILRAFRPHQFIAKVAIERANQAPIRRKLIPDYTYFVELDGKSFVICIEVQHRVHSVIPASPHTISSIKTFDHKIKTYREFSKNFRGHSTITEHERFYHSRFDGIISLFVTTRRTEIHLQNLIQAANRGPTEEKLQFLFARLEQLKQEKNNVFLSPIWHMANRKKVSIL